MRGGVAEVATWRLGEGGDEGEEEEEEEVNADT